MHVAKFLDRPHRPEESWTSGLAGLDEVVGGFRRGQLWVITGAPTTGKSMLMCQLVFRLAVEHGFATEYSCTTVADEELVRARRSLATGRASDTPASSVSIQQGLESSTRERLAALRSSALDVSVSPGFVLPEPSYLWHTKTCVAVDDPEFKRPRVLDEVARGQFRSLADAGAVVLVTVPRGHCVDGAGPDQRLREEWTSVAHVMIETVSGDAGASVLRVVKNSRGPRRDVEVVALGTGRPSRPLPRSSRCAR